MKIGILGGTFNPIHYGHLINANIIKEDHSLERIVFIPSKVPVHKAIEGDVSVEDRFGMIKLAIEDNIGFDVSRIEIDRLSDSYTITSIKQLSDIYEDSKLYFIMGYDSFMEIETWKNYEKILEIISIIILNRPGDFIVKKRPLEIAKEVIFANNPHIEISSSYIRNLIREGKSIKYLVPQRVEEYIIEKGLYRN